MVTITLYVRRSDPYALFESVLSDLGVAYELRFKDADDPHVGAHLAATRYPVLDFNGKYTFLGSPVSPEAFKVLVQSYVAGTNGTHKPQPR